MPLFDLECECGFKDERLLGMSESLPECPKCGRELYKKFSNPPMIYWKGDGGYPSRHRQIFNTTYRIHPKLD